MSETAALPAKVDSENLVFELNSFKDQYKAFNFYTPKGKTLEGLKTHLDSVTKGKGEETLLMLANANIDFRFRGKAKQMLKDDEEVQERLAANRTLLISVEEALAYEPGSRDQLSEQGLLRKRSEFVEKAIEAKKAGDMDNYRVYALEVIELNKALDEIAKKVMEDFSDVANS